MNQKFSFTCLLLVSFSLLGFTLSGVAEAQHHKSGERLTTIGFPTLSRVYIPIVTKPITLGDLDKMVYVPAGEFQMGCTSPNGGYSCNSNSKPLHDVYLSKYYIDKYEVTNVEYAAYMNQRGDNDCSNIECLDLNDDDIRIFFQDGIYVAEPGYEYHPVGEVTWNGADAYCTDQGKRLPTEAEWEKAARGASDTRTYPWGEYAPDCSLVNFEVDEELRLCVGDTTPVDSYPLGASPYNALSLAGNVSEWVHDYYFSDYYDFSPYRNPQGPLDSSYRVIRGAGFTSSASMLPLSGRWYSQPHSANIYIGFRCASDSGS